MKASRALSLLALALLVGCKASYITHDEDKAAEQALRFAKAAFVTRNISEAYGFLVPDLQNQLPIDTFRATVEKMHPDGFPSSLEATEFEPAPGQESMQIFVNGRDGSSIFHYRFVMVGTKATGYRIAGMYRSGTPYATAPLRQSLRSSAEAS